MNYLGTVAFRNIGLLKILLVLIILLVANGSGRCEEKSIDVPQSPQEVITLDAVDFRELEMGSNNSVSKFAVAVRNIDKVRWLGVKVIFRFPSGREFVGFGSKTLESGRQGSYTLNENQLEEARSDLLGAFSDFEVPKVIVSHLETPLSRD